MVSVEDKIITYITTVNGLNVLLNCNVEFNLEGCLPVQRFDLINHPIIYLNKLAGLTEDVASLKGDCSDELYSQFIDKQLLLHELIKEVNSEWLPDGL